jgi:hypothetical protein
MLEYLITEGGMTPIQFLDDSKDALLGVVPTIVSKQSIGKMAITWNSRTGRCTSLAVKAVHVLAGRRDAQGQPVYDWCIYDLGRHRIARRRKTGVVFDSSSTMAHGAFQLREGQWQQFADTNASWKYSSSESKFKSQGNPNGRVVGAVLGYLLPFLPCPHRPRIKVTHSP